MTRADDIQREQSDLQKELESIQSNCNHKTETIRWCPKESNYKWQCDECNARTRYPSIPEITKYLS